MAMILGTHRSWPFSRPRCQSWPRSPQLWCSLACTTSCARTLSPPPSTCRTTRSTRSPSGCRSRGSALAREDAPSCLLVVLQSFFLWFNDNYFIIVLLFFWIGAMGAVHVSGLLSCLTCRLASVEALRLATRNCFESTNTR